MTLPAKEDLAATVKELTKWGIGGLVAAAALFMLREQMTARDVSHLNSMTAQAVVTKQVLDVVADNSDAFRGLAVSVDKNTHATSLLVSQVIGQRNDRDREDREDRENNAYDRGHNAKPRPE